MIRDGQPCFAVWEVRTWKSKADVPEFEHGAGPISWATDDRIAMAAHGIRIWDFAEKKLVHSSYPSDAHGYFGRRVHYSTNGRWLIYGDPFVSEVDDVEKGQTIGRLQTSGNATRAMAYSDDGDLIAVGTDANTLQVIDAATGRLVNLFDGHTDSVTAVSFHPHGNTLISGGEDKAIRVWSLENHRLKKTLTGHESTVSSLDWHRVQSRW
jgi:WD40 repeat protein